MNYTACNIIYVNRVAKHDELVRHDMDISTILKSILPLKSSNPSVNPDLLEHNVKKLMRVFNEVYLCTTGKSCISKLYELSRGSVIDLVPTIVLIDVPNELGPDDRFWKEVQSYDLQPPVPMTTIKEEEYTRDEYPRDEPKIEDKYGLELLQHIASEIEHRILTSLIVPVAMVEAPNLDTYMSRSNSLISLQPLHILSSGGKLDERTITASSNYQIHTVRSLDTGAVDVLISPIAEERLSSLLIHAYRAHYNALKEHRALIEMRRNRKKSWVGLKIDHQKPTSDLREAMVSGLMDGICQIGDHEPHPTCLKTPVVSKHKEAITAALASWHFSAHEFTDDELLHAALLMLQHTLKMPELEPWRISTEELTRFLLASRSAYNAFVPYHNFRHVVDVLQACFIFLIKLGRIPNYPDPDVKVPSHPSILADSLRPYDALTLLITAIGHDVGHPGVNNAFLTSLNAPLAQLYNDRSVLETFHCAAYSQILRRHWPAAFRSAEMRQRMISTILATDMGLHFEYMKKLAQVTESLHPSDSFKEKQTSWSSGEQRTLACSLLIKCADISNVARKFDVASSWTMILTDEFARQATMEKEMGIPTVLFAAPVREIVTLGKSQINFIETFAFPLFQGVAEIMPAMTFCVEELKRNKIIWNEKITKKQLATNDVNTCDKDLLIISPPMKARKFSTYSQCLAVPNEEKSKKKPYLKPIDISLSDTNFQNLSPFTNMFSKKSSNAISRESSRSNSPLSRPSSFKQDSNSAEDGSPASTNSKESDLNSVINTQPPEDGFCRNEAEANGSVADDLTSEATSDNQPPSPSTQVSSTTSYSENHKDLISPLRVHRSHSTLDYVVYDESKIISNTVRTTEDKDGYLKNAMVVQKVRVLKKKKPSRFRMSFWKRSKRNGSRAGLALNSDDERTIGAV